MELIDLLRVIRRWLWLIVAIVVVTELALWLGMRSAEPVYTAAVSLQISTPQREEVAAYDEYRSISLRDEITVAINNLIELLQSDEVYKRTTSQLGLEEKDAHYTIAAKRASDADFINVIVEARTPDLAAEIANTHVNVAIAYYGELRAQSTKAEKGLFAEQLRMAENEFRVAEKALSDFRTQNGIYSLESQMSTQQKLLEQLQLERDQRLLEGATTLITTTDSTAPITTTKKATKSTPVATATAPPVIDSVAEVDKLIAQRLKELDQFTALVPQYNILAQNVEQARAGYQHLLSKYSEAELKVTAVQAANFIQVIKPAYAPSEPESGWPKLAVFALAGSLGLGVVLAFFLQYIFSFKTASVIVPVSDQKTLSRERPKLVTQNQVSKTSVSDHKKPSPEHPSRELWKRIRNIFRRNIIIRRNDPSYARASRVSSTDFAADQEPNAVQGQPGSTETNVA
jgi:uncharacterized protein involved in exopolysaccharide biosynthesis